MESRCGTGTIPQIFTLFCLAWLHFSQPEDEAERQGVVVLVAATEAGPDPIELNRTDREVPAHADVHAAAQHHRKRRSELAAGGVGPAGATGPGTAEQGVGKRRHPGDGAHGQSGAKTESVERLVGIVSIGDLVKSTIDEQRDTIENLTSYIVGKYT